MTSSLLSLFGVTLGSSMVEKLEVIGETVGETFMTPQPVGLTNILCKVIGPYFTKLSTHSHPDIRDVKEIALKIVEMPNSNDLATLAARDESDEVHLPPTDDTECGKVATFCESSRPTIRVLTHLVSHLAEPVEFLSPYISHSKCDYELASAQALSHESPAMMMVAAAEDPLAVYDVAHGADFAPFQAQLSNDTIGVIRQLEVMAAVQIGVQQFGHFLERAVSAALLGKECYWNVMRDAILQSLADEPTLHAAAALAQMAPDHLISFIPYIAAGVHLPDSIEHVKAYLLSQHLHRPILIYNVGGATSSGPTLFAALPDTSQQRTRRPLLIFDGAAIVPCRPPSIDPETPFNIVFSPKSPTLIVLPSSAELEDFVFINNDGDIVLNPQSPSPPFEFAPFEELARRCSKFTHSDGTLCFSSFPAAGFSLCDDPDRKVSDALLNASGFGLDGTRAAEYLNDELAQMTNVAPLHVDSDGHCLLHAISRCLVGKEYLWHALRNALFSYFRDKKQQIGNLFKKNEMLTSLVDEFDFLIRRAHPDYIGEDDKGATALARGLGSEHIFILCNLLRRPILLVDSMKFANPESYVFLPLLVDPSQCITKKILVIGWNNSAHVHYVPIVPICSKFPATIPLSSMPRCSSKDLETPRQVLVYACPSDADPDKLLADYVSFTTPKDNACSSCSSGSAFAEVGGSFYDIRPWAHGVAEEFRREHGMSIWAIHELVRCNVHQTSGIANATLEVIPKLTEFTKRCVEMLSTKRLYYCPLCTRTVDEPKCCTALDAAFNPQSGRFTYQSTDRLPIESNLGFSCCVFKHWYSHGGPVKCGSIIFARDLSGSFQVARIENCNSDGTIDVKFFHTGREVCTRYKCPGDEFMCGFPTDHTVQNFSLAFGGISSRQPIILDANPMICTDPAVLAKQFVAANLNRLPAERRVPELVSRYQEQVRSDVETTLSYMKRQAMVKASRRRKSNAQLPTTKPQSAKQRVPKFKDEEGNDVQWESRDPKNWDWIPYEHSNNGLIEAAYQDGDVSQAIEISGFGTFTIHFSSWLQENALGYARSVRRVVTRKWECPNCTFENEGKDHQCQMCIQQMIVTERPASAVTVTGTRVTTISSDDDDDDDDDADEDKLLLTQQAFAKKTLEDPELARGGRLYISAQKIRGHFVTFPIKYGRSCEFFLSSELERYVPLPKVVQKTDPLFSRITASRVSSLSFIGGDYFCWHGHYFAKSAKTGSLIHKKW